MQVLTKRMSNHDPPIGNYSKLAPVKIRKGLEIVHYPWRAEG